MFELANELKKYSDSDLKKMYDELNEFGKKGFLGEGLTDTLYNKYKENINVSNPRIFDLMIIENNIYKEMANRFYDRHESEDIIDKTEGQNEYYGSFSITAKIDYKLRADTKSEAKEKLFNASFPMVFIDRNEEQEIEITTQEWDIVNDIDNKKLPHIVEFEIHKGAKK